MSDGVVALASRKFPFSPALTVGDAVYVSGHLGIHLETGVGPSDPVEEARLLMENFKASVERAGRTMDDLVWVDVFCTDLDLFAAFNAVYLEYFSEPYPARQFIGVSKLLFERRFEVSGVAMKDGAAKKVKA